ncbi:MAG: GNAT family N-acetyltransferase [Verrucomicrobiota bacterium]
MVSAHLISDEPQFSELEPIWNALLASSGGNSVFQTWEYIQQWRQTCGQNFDLRILVARDSESKAIRGIAPFMAGKGHTRARSQVRHLSFLGQLSESASDYGDFLIEPGFEELVVREFARYVVQEMADDWSLLYLPVSRADSSTISGFVENLKDFGVRPRLIHHRPAPFVELPADWDTFLKSKSRNMRKKIKRSMSKLEEKYETRLLTAGEDLPLEEGLEKLIELNQMRWGEEAQSFHTPEFTEFHQRLASEFATKGWLSLRFLVLDGEFAAAQYDFVYGNKAWGFQAGWNPKFAEDKVSRALISYSLRDFIAAGLTEYDFLAGDAEYKTHWASVNREVFDLEIANPRCLRAQLFSVVRKFRQTDRKVA